MDIGSKKKSTKPRSSKYSSLGKPITVTQFAKMLKRIQGCKDRGENINSILARECILEHRTATDREKTFAKVIWVNDNLTWINLQSDNPIPIKGRFSRLPIGTYYKCLETDEIYFKDASHIYDWTESKTNQPMHINWDEVTYP